LALAHTLPEIQIIKRNEVSCPACKNQSYGVHGYGARFEREFVTPVQSKFLDQILGRNLDRNLAPNLPLFWGHCINMPDYFSVQAIKQITS
jgi:hypothetical protein